MEIYDNWELIDWYTEYISIMTAMYRTCCLQNLLSVFCGLSAITADRLGKNILHVCDDISIIETSY